jgi:radical SAM protein with 4Fe4S-binding SPASM domain
MTDLMKKENDDLMRNFLNRTFFTAWKPENKDNKDYINYRGLELQVNGFCDLECKYCYYAKFQDQLYPTKIASKKNILKNLDLVLDWLEKNGLEPELELFSGELFFQDIGYEVLERIIDWQNKNNNKNHIAIPTNYSFIFDEDKIKRLENLFEKCDGRIFLSCSVDGKYCDANRPFKTGKIRTDEYYDRMFRFAKKWGFGFHPMIYSENIENWKDNWLWFQNNLKKYEIPFDQIYLLEVRNVEWNKRQIREYYKFIRFVLNWTWNFVKDNVAPEQFPKFIFDKKLFNMFNIFSTTIRGLGCSMQSTSQLRLGDLTSSVCHRTAYKAHNLWRFKVENDAISGVEAINYNLAIAAASYDFKNSPFCNYCSIRELCTGQCLGSMYETNGDPFTPIPTVCAVEHAKVAAIFDELKDLGLHTHFYDWAQAKQSSMKLYYEYLQGEGNAI